MLDLPDSFSSCESRIRFAGAGTIGGWGRAGDALRQYSPSRRCSGNRHCLAPLVQRELEEAQTLSRGSPIASD